MTPERDIWCLCMFACWWLWGVTVVGSPLLASPSSASIREGERARHSHILQVYRHPKYKSRHPKYKYRHPNTSPDTQNTSPDTQIQVQTPKYKSRHQKYKSRHQNTSPDTQNARPDTSNTRPDTQNRSSDTPNTCPNNPNTDFRMYISIYSHIRLYIYIYI